MKRIFVILLLALSIFTLSACNNKNSKSNTISVVELTERENAILSITSDESFVFDFNIDSEYKEASVWIEKYETGKLVNDKISQITSQIEGNGSIIFTTSKIDNNEKHLAFNIGLSSSGSTGSTNGLDTISDGKVNMSAVWGTFQGENTSIDGQVVLASICYSKNESVMNSISTKFYQDAESHLNELAEYDVVYLIKTEFLK
ncbi:hypothetical protein [Fredinandcohnia quinoae]|uniref:Uncharacterized protein n=1 Tax=Fredinandcohnia quinoae TaxID=2918902 RepID=A0AAW5E295_9BACI|nr:hypothetical protein [Fredinandcohnia sp. SECRCQ15]MCH1626738.1 hypothetical protein [Fredinandcohnia sp. SECRCQ15]